LLVIFMLQGLPSSQPIVLEGAFYRTLDGMISVYVLFAFLS
jgi:hypothetical protein